MPVTLVPKSPLSAKRGRHAACRTQGWYVVCPRTVRKLMETQKLSEGTKGGVQQQRLAVSRFLHFNISKINKKPKAKSNTSFLEGGQKVCKKKTRVAPAQSTKKVLRVSKEKVNHAEL